MKKTANKVFTISHPEDIENESHDHLHWYYHVNFSGLYYITETERN